MKFVYIVANSEQSCQNAIKGVYSTADIAVEALRILQEKMVDNSYVTIYKLQVDPEVE